MRPKRNWREAGLFNRMGRSGDAPQKPVLVFVISALTAAMGGLVGIVTHLSGDRGGGAGSAWRATAENFFAASAARRVVTLDEGWRFASGDDPAWSAVEFDDRGWRPIRVDEPWESQGAAGYDGFAWYRCRFDPGAAWPPGELYLRLGRIDDTDEVWLNGTRLGGTGEPGGERGTAWDVMRHYRIPPGCLRAGTANVIAVRVWDQRLGGGFVEGTPAILVQDLPAPLLDLGGRVWSLSKDDRPAHRIPTADTTDFAPVVVPGGWDAQGWAGFDGDRWYRVTFTTPDGVGAASELVLVLGVIDDEDETYLNGALIGRTVRSGPDDEVWRRERVYRFPATLLQSGAEANVLAVRVHDDRGEGGIVRGPVGILRPADWAVFAAGRDGSARAWARWWNWLLGRS